MCGLGEEKKREGRTTNVERDFIVTRTAGYVLSLLIGQANESGSLVPRSSLGIGIHGKAYWGGELEDLRRYLEGRGLFFKL